MFAKALVFIALVAIVIIVTVTACLSLQKKKKKKQKREQANKIAVSGPYNVIKNNSKMEIDNDALSYGYSTDTSNDGTSTSLLPIQGTDTTFKVGDLLKETDKKVDYDNIEEGAPITVEQLAVPGAFLVHNLLTPNECQQYIEIAEDMGFALAPLRDLSVVNSEKANFSKRTLSIRNSMRVLFDVPDHIGFTLNERLLKVIPQTIEYEGKTWHCQQLEQGKAGGVINKRWRFNKYNKGNYFKKHYDAGFIYSQKEKTLFTFILYLNDNFEGGETVFYGNRNGQFDNFTAVKPTTGTALIFYQTGKLSPLHEGATQSATGKHKYILRSDLAYYCE